MKMKMKIVHVINCMGSGGVETFLKKLSVSQAEKNDVIIISLTKHNIYNSDDFLNVGVKFISFDFDKIYDFRIVYKLRAILKDISPDLVHVHLFPGQFVVPFASLFLSLPLITTEHGVSLRRVKYKLFHFLEFFSFCLYKRIVCVSDAVREGLLKEYKGFANKLVTIKNGIDLQEMDSTLPVRKSELSDKFCSNDIIICMVGRLDVGKDFKTLIDSLEILPLNYKLLIVGQGRRELELKDYVASKGLVDRVHFFGFQKKIYYIYKSIDIFVLSSEREGLPMVLLEAMAAKKPCLGSDVEGISGLIPREYLFQYMNANELSNKILSIEKDDRLGDIFYEIAQMHSFDKMVSSYNEEYLSLI